MSRSFTLGPVGLIPESEYLRKIEENNIPDEINDYEAYLRKQLVDFRPDAPFFESDQIRDPSDRGSGVGSRERLSLRHNGTRSGVAPDLPDGTFLDHEFMERDVRGTQNLPNMKEDRKQREARGKFIKFSNDNDYSVPETGINPVQMVSLIRGTQQQIKDRFANFEESFDNFHNGSSRQRGDTSTVALVTHDGTIVDLASVAYKHRMDPVNLLSNRVPGMPRYTEPDHRVKVSKYGQVRPVMDLNANSWNENRNNSYLDHKTPIPFNGQLLNRALAIMILDIEGQRSTKQIAAQGVDYSESEVTQLRDSRQVVNPSDVFKLIAMGLASQTQTTAAHQQYFSGPANNRQINVKSDIREALLAGGKINHHQAASMVQATRTLGPQQQKDLRDLVIDAGARVRHDLEQSTRKPTNKTSNTLIRDSLDTRHLEESKGVKMYSNVQPVAPMTKLTAVDYESYKKSSAVLKNGSRAISAKHVDVRTTENDVNMEEFALPDRKKQQSSSHGSYGGRSLQADFGDMDKNESISKLDMKHKKVSNVDDIQDMHEMLFSMVNDAV